MHNKEFDRLVGLWKKEKLLQSKGVAPAKTKDCLFFTEFEAYTKNGCEVLTSAQKQHIESCAYCQKMIAGFEKAAREEKQPIPIYERLTQALENLTNSLTFPLKALPRLAPALVPVLAVIIAVIIFSNQPLELRSYSLEFAPTIKTRGQQLPEEKIFKIRLTTNYNCRAYLFELDVDKLNLLAEEEILKKTANIIPKDNWLRGEGKLILILSKKPLPESSRIQKVIVKNYKKGEKEALIILRKYLKRGDIALRFL